MEGERLVKKIYRAEVEGNRRRGRPMRRWMDGVKGCLSERGLSIPEAEECVKDRREWGDVDGPGRSRLYETVKAVNVFDLLRSGI